MQLALRRREPPSYSTPQSHPYYSNNTGLTDGQTFILSVDGHTDLTVDGAGTQIATTSAVTNGTGSTVDAPPIVASIVRVDSTPTNADSVQFTVTFSEDVTGVDIADFTVTTVSGDATGFVASIASVDASTYTVTVNSIIGDGSIRLDVIVAGD